MTILVTGGAGYIGSFMVKRLLDTGDAVVVIDSLERGHKEAVDPRAKLAVGNLLDKVFLDRFFTENKAIEAVIHFAGYISMAESVEHPGLYFENNTYATLCMLEQMRKRDITNFIFSSTAGVYGNPIKIPIPEDHEKAPTNPYGESKLMVEKMLSWYKTAYKLSFCSLRYFNAAGAALNGSMGENHAPETHIIPLAINAALGKQHEFVLYGTDYKTADGTAIRDYIHVLDLVEAHYLALQKLKKEKSALYFNVGTGKGYSNKEVVEIVKKVTGVNFSVKQVNRRPGDAEVLIADPTKIQSDLDFSCKYSDIDTIISSAWLWYKKTHNIP